MHRSVWAEGVRNRCEAMNWINNSITSLARRTGAGTILDIGCGVGGSIIVLAQEGKRRITGVTLSPVQAELGNTLLEERGLRGGIQEDVAEIICGDFTSPELRLSQFDLAYAVETYLHISDKDRFFKKAAKSLKPGGHLVICDDFLLSAEEGRPIHEGQRRVLERFRRGWCAQGLTSSAEMKEQAGEYGFAPEEERDLTPYLELGRPRDILIRGLVFLLGWLPVKTAFWKNLLGGDALQRLLKQGILGYRYILLRREGGFPNGE